MLFFDVHYLFFMAPAFLLALFATMKVKSTFAKYSKIQAQSGLTGAQAAQTMLERQGIQGVQIEPVQGMLSDHYDPRNKTLRLSPKVYQSRSLSALGVACHEAGHAIQDAHGYAPLTLRTALVPFTSFGSSASYILILLGFLFSSAQLFAVGAILFSVVVLFSLVTLPVEWDASKRAKLALVEGGMLSNDEIQGASKVLDAAFLTYVASAVTALLTLLYYLMRSGLLGRR